MILEIITYAFVAIFSGISQSAGIGGGPILNISLMIGLGYDTKYSMAITYIFLMGGATASIWKNISKKNPKTGGPMIDYTLIMLTLPSIVSGSLFGTILNHFISELIITILFCILLIYLIQNSYSKIKQANQRQNLIDETIPMGPQIELENVEHGSFQIPQNFTRLQQILNYEKQVYPKDKLKIMGHIFIYTLLVLLAKGGDHYDSLIGLQSCGIGSWILVLFHMILSYLYTKSVAIQKYRLDAQKQNLGFIYDNPSEMMSETKMNSCIFYGFLAGMTGGMLSIGGAMILVPVWIHKGIDKSVAVSSSGPLIFFASSVAFILSLLSGKYDTFFGILFYFTLSFIGSYLVRDVVDYISKKYQLKTMIFILLIIVMTSSLFSLLPYEIFQFYKNPGSFMQFGQFC